MDETSHSELRPDVSWCGVLEHHAARTPTKPLAVHGDRVVTYADMQQWSAQVAGGFAARGVGAGDVVALLSYNNLEFLATIFAANHLGAIAMPINWRLAAPELRFILEHSGARGAGVRSASSSTSPTPRPRGSTATSRASASVTTPSPAGSGSPTSASTVRRRRARRPRPTTSTA